jgi:hypothetical protein
MCVRSIEFALSTIFIFYFGIVGIVWYLLFFIIRYLKNLCNTKEVSTCPAEYARNTWNVKVRDRNGETNFNVLIYIYIASLSLKESCI